MECRQGSSLRAAPRAWRAALLAAAGRARAHSWSGTAAGRAAAAAAFPRAQLWLPSAMARQ